MPYSLGSNCHITLQHASINGGVTYGFILQRDTRTPAAGPAVSIQKEVDSDGGINDRVFFSVLLADSLINPDGSPHTDTRAAMYAMLLLFLAQSADLTLVCPAGVLSGLGALGHVSTEMHYGDHSIVVCQLTDIGVYFPPADPAAFNASVWDGTLTWATSYWR
jgi:hypothetical protein